jgi:uncharacterized protein YqgV (UPF0045/DUF77 family)
MLERVQTVTQRRHTLTPFYTLLEGSHPWQDMLERVQTVTQRRHTLTPFYTLLEGSHPWQNGIQDVVQYGTYLV